MTRGRSRFVSNTAALAASTAASTLLTLVQVKVLATALLPETFGLFAALRGLSLLGSMLAANGFPQLLVRFLPICESKGQASRAIVLSGACFLSPLLLLSVFVFGMESHRALFFGVIPAGWLGGDGESSRLFLWFYLTTLGVTLKLVLYGGFSGLRRMPAQVAVEVASLAAQVAWIVAWRDHLTLARLFTILGTTALAACAVGLPWYFARLFADVTTRRAPADRAAGRGEGTGYREYWLGATGMSLVAVAFTDVDRYVLSRVLVLETLGQFHIGSRLLRLANRFLAVPVLAFQPEITRLEAEGRGDTISSSTAVFFKFNALVATAVAAVVVVLAPDLVRLVSSARYDAAVGLLRILAVSIPLTAMTAPLTAVMKALDQVRRALYCDLAWAVVYLGLLVALGSVWGLIGAGAAAVAASAVQLSLAYSLGRVRPGPGAAAAAAARAVLCAAVAFGPVALAGSWVARAPLAVVVKVLLLPAALVVFRAMARRLGVFSRGERESLASIAGGGARGAIAGWIV